MLCLRAHQRSSEQQPCFGSLWLGAVSERGSSAHWHSSQLSYSWAYATRVRASCASLALAPPPLQALALVPLYLVGQYIAHAV